MSEGSAHLAPSELALGHEVLLGVPRRGVSQEGAGHPGASRRKRITRATGPLEAVLFALDVHQQRRRLDVHIARQINPADAGRSTHPLGFGAQIWCRHHREHRRRRGRPQLFSRAGDDRHRCRLAPGHSKREARRPHIGDEPEVGDAGRGADVDPGLQEFSEMGGNFGRTSHVSFIPLFACTHKSALFRSSGWHPMLLPAFMNASCSSHAHFDGFAVHPRRRRSKAPTASNRTVG